MSTAGTYFVAGALLTATAYKVSEYVFFSGYETSRIRPFFAASAAALYSLALKAHLNPGWIDASNIAFSSYITGIACVINFLAAQILVEGSGKWAKIRSPSASFTTPREARFQPLLPRIEGKKIIFLEGPSSLNKDDFVYFYLKKKALNVHVLPLEYCNLESFLHYGNEILSICKRSHAVLYIRDADWLLDQQNFSSFCRHVGAWSVQIIACVEATDNGNLNATKIFIPPASQEETTQILASKYPNMSPEDKTLIMRAASFLVNEPFPGSVLRLYKSYQEQTDIDTSLIEFLKQKLELNHFWLQPDTTPIKPRQEFILLEDVRTKINKVLYDASKANSSSNAPLASIVLTGGSLVQKTAIAETIATQLFEGRLIKISPLDLQWVNPELIIERASTQLRKHSQHVILIEDIDQFWSLPGSLILPFLTKVLKGELEALPLQKSLVIITAKDNSKLPEDWSFYATLLSLPQDSRRSLDSTKAAEYVTRLSAARDSQHALERDAESAELQTDTLQHRGAILVGPVASGKTDLVLKLSQQDLQGREIVRLNLTSFMGNSTYVGQFEDHVTELKERLKTHRSILVIEGAALLIPDVLHDYYKFAPQLEAMIEEGGFSTIITLTEEEHKRLKDQSPKLVSQLKRIDLKPLSEEKTHTVLKKVRPRIDERAIHTVLQYAHYLRGSLPGSAINFLGQMSGPVTEETILNRFTKELKIDLEWLQKRHPGFSKKVESAKTSLKQKIHGQDKAIDRICDTIQVRHLGISPSPTKTLGNFLLQGPPGVGKTYFAQLLSEELFQKNFIRIDMQHLIDPNYLVKLTEHGGPLSQLNDHPFTVVLLDEIEKAPREAQDALLGILQDGRFVDKKGYEVQFDHAVVVMTTNAGRLDNYFTPAFISRVTPIFFNPLSKEALKSVVQGRLKIIKDRCESHEIIIDLSPFIDYLLGKMEQFKVNARELDSFLEQEVSRKLIPLFGQESKNFTVFIEQDSLTFKAT